MRRESKGGKPGMSATLAAIIIGGLVCLLFGWLAWIRSVEKLEMYSFDSVPRLSYDYTWTDYDLLSDSTSTVASCDILLRIHGLDIPRDAIEGAIVEEGDTSDGVADGLNSLLDPSHVAVDIQYTRLQWLPGPSIVWMKMEDGAVNAVVFLYADEEEVVVSDPSSGVVTYGFSDFEKQYDFANRAAVYICARGYEPQS